MSLIEGFMRKERIWDAVDAERARQDAKWGEQNHDDFTWMAILAEEVGEVAKAALHHNGDEPGVTASEATLSHLREELVQVAAVAVAWLEAIDRRK